MIRMQGVTRRFGSVLALHDVNLRVLSGEVVALVGPNGAGKSTTLRVLAGALKPTSGTALIGRYDVTASDGIARRGLGYLPQKAGMPLDSVIRDLLTLVARIRGASGSEVEDSIRAMRLEPRLDARLSELSGGERQRVMLALATLGPITALLLDEPSISLDSDGAEDVRTTIAGAAAAGTAVLFASHHLSDVAALADRIAVMVEGRIVACGTLLELALQAGMTWDVVRKDTPALEPIYQILVARARGLVPPGSPQHVIVRGAA